MSAQVAWRTAIAHLRLDRLVVLRVALDDKVKHRLLVLMLEQTVDDKR